MFDKEIYIKRRKVLSEKIESGIVLFLGNGEAPANYQTNCYKFRQDSSFLYYFGLNEPDLAAVLDIDSGEEILFGNDVNIDDIIWMGPQPSISERAESTGISKSARFADLKTYLGKALSTKRQILFLPQYRFRNMILLGEMLDTPAGNINEKASEKLIRAVVSMRLIKGPEEIRQIDKACQIGYQMHYTAMKTVRLGMKEQEVAGIMEGIAHSKGSMVSFSTILSQHGETMHNHLHDKIIENGKLILIDAGAENDMNYCSDFTRTIPSGGKFTQRQKEIYEIVSGANNLCQETARPGITYLEVHLKVCRHILCGLAGLGLVKGNIDEALAAGAAALFMPHGLGHNMGLDVHDMENLGEDFVGYDEGQHRSSQFGLDALRMARKLVPGHVITDEPGIYFIPALIEKWKREKINTRYIDFGKLAGYYDFGGIRLEDDILITESGCRLLGQKRLPITVENVEEEMKDNNR